MLLLAVVWGASACVSDGDSRIEKWETDRRVEAHVDLGMDYLRRNQLETADDKFDQALEINPASDRAYHGKALVQIRLTRYDQANRWFERAIALNRDNFTAMNDYGIQLCRQGQIERGLVQLERVITLRKGTVPDLTWLGLGVCHFQANNLDTAKQHFQTVLQSNPVLPQALLPMAEIAYRQSNYLSSRGFLERYFAADVVNAKALLLAAQVEFQLDDADKARFYARELRARFPQSPELAEVKEFL